MERAGALVLGLLLSVALLVGVPVATAAAARPATDFITMDSTEQHSAGKGTSRTWSADQITTVHREGNALLVEVRDTTAIDSPTWTWMIRAPEGEPLVVGTYENAQGSWAPNPRPTLYFGGGGSTCGDSTGRFRVLELAPDLSRIWIVYEHRCGEAPQGYPEAAAWGEIRIGLPQVAVDSVLLPTDLELPDWYPGLDAQPEPFTLFNTGTDDLEVTGAEVVAGATDFRVVSGLASCADLAPRESCRIFVGFRPAAAEQRNGLLRLATSRGPMDVSLTGYGYPGLTEFHLRGGGTEEYVMTPDTWRMVGTNLGQMEHPARAAAFHASEPGYAEDWVNIGFTAPEGGFQAGRTYSACCTDAGPEMSLGITGRGYRPGGTYTVHEVAYDAEGFLKRFSASFRMRTGGWFVGTIAWRASARPPMPSIPPDSAADPLTVETDRSTYTSGEHAAVTVTVPGGAGAETTLYAGRHFGGPYVVGTTHADALGRARFDVPLTSEHSFYAASGAHAGQALVEVAQTPRVVAKPQGQLRREGRFFLFRAGRLARILGAASTVYGEECLHVEVQGRRNGGWRPVEARDPCLPIVEGAVAKTSVAGQVGDRRRVRLILPALGVRPLAASEWIYLKFVRRAG